MVRGTGSSRGTACAQGQARRRIDLEITLNLPDGHNVQNALAAIAVAPSSAFRTRRSARRLAEFRGVGRRFHATAGFLLARTAGRQAASRWWTIRASPVEMRATL